MLGQAAVALLDRLHQYMHALHIPVHACPLPTRRSEASHILVKAYLFDGVTHLLEMGLLVEVTGHLFGQQSLYYICCTEDDPTAQKLQQK